MTVEDIFQFALEEPDGAAREAFLETVCAGDADLRRRVDDLLAAHFRSGEFLHISASNEKTVTIQGDGASPEDMEGMHFLTPSTRPDSLGRISHYEVLQVLGKGGFGIVFRAFDDVLQRVVAVKMMAPQLAATSPARKRFLREARSSAAVRHENVVQVYEVVEQPLPYLVMEFIPGGTLQELLNRTGPLDVKETLRIGRQIAEGLAAAHATDLIHRDIKPSNILIEGGQNRVKITDFGLARAADDASISQSGIIAGTPMYMAPEQAQGQPLDQRADLFSLGSVLYQMASGRPPFRANSTVAVLKRVAEETPRSIREIIPETPQWLCDIIAKLHAKNPEDRYQTAREVADVLADCEAQLKANSKLKDFTRIPRGRPATRSTGNRKWVAAFVLVLAVAYLAAGLRYGFFNRPSGMVTLQCEDPEARLVFTNESDGSERDLKPGDERLDSGFYRVEVQSPPGRRVENVLVTEGTHTREVDKSRFQVKLARGDRMNVKVLLSPVNEGNTGWVQLFNGKDLMGWELHPQEANRSWEVENGELILKGDSPSHLFSKRDFAPNVHVKYEAKCNSLHNSFKVLAPFQFKSDGRLNGCFGSEMGGQGVFAPGVFGAFSKGLLAKPDEWFTKELIIQGGTIKVIFNGVLVSQMTTKSPMEGRSGRLAIFEHPGTARFRKIEIKELPASVPVSDDFVQLFNGKDLAGWKTNPEQPGTWNVSDGILIGSTTQSHLFTERADFANFHFRAEMKLNEGGDSGIRFRAPFNLMRGPKPWQVLPSGGYEAEFTNLNVASAQSGSIWRVNQEGPPDPLFRAVDPTLPRPDVWCIYEIVADGNRFITKIDGKEVAACTDAESMYTKGHIALQCFSAQSYVQFRKIEIKELPPRAAAGPTPPDPALVKTLSDVVDAKQRVLDTTKTRFDAGIANRMEVLAVEVDLIEARIKLAEAQKDKSAILEQLEGLVKARGGEREQTAQLIQAGRAPVNEQNTADARLAEAKARLAEAKVEMP